MTVQEYIENISKRYAAGNATEHTFRGDLQQLIESLVPSVSATNEPKRQLCGAPDYILTKKDIPIGFIEAKDIGDKDLEGAKKTGNKGQFDRYKASLNNLFFTDYINFHLYKNGQFVTKIAIAELTDKGIKPLAENFLSFENLIKDFCATIGQSITSSKKLAEMMASKARLLSEVIEKALTTDEKNNEDSTLKDQMNAFKNILIHDITQKGFADVYAQTIAYGMFAARYHDPTLPTFSRQEAYQLIPKSNPFLKKLFGYIAGLDLDDRIKWIVDDLVNIFLACDVTEILRNYGKNTKMEDPIIHFYEDFLSEYDPILRKSRGVWYTPQPVVNFIVRAVDDILKTEFDLPLGLADNSKLGIKNYELGTDEEVHKVQILDPATGTGTFLAEVVKNIHKKFENQPGIWNDYVENNLLPRLNGFELLMASYAMAHLQLDLLLTETGYKSTNNQRLRVFLTNSLEEGNTVMERGFANWLSIEANEASKIKNETPVMCVIGNPPYAVSSTNKSEWIQNLIADYKKNLNERKINLDDDYIKFIRFGQHFIDKNGSGVLAYISNNSFLDGVTHRQMRKHLLESFDKIYILDLHGNAKKKEVCPDGSPDQNVFDIMQGVSINIFVKTGKKKANELGQVFHFDLQGKRSVKSVFLEGNSLKTVAWTNLNPIAPYYFIVPKNFSETKSYEMGFKVNELFLEFNTGIQTKRDKVTIHFKYAEAIKTQDFFKNNDIDVIRKKFDLPDDGRDWSIKDAKNDLSFSKAQILTLLYRPFDFRKILYTGKTKGIVAYPRHNTSKHLLHENNLSLITLRINGENEQFVCLLSKYLVEKGSLAKGNYSFFPLYLYPETKGEIELSENQKSLEAKLEEAKMLAEAFAKSFVSVKKMFDAFANPDNELKKYYKEQLKIKEKLEANVAKFKQELATFSNQNLFAEEPRKPNLNPEIVKKIAENLGLKFVHEKEITKGTFAPIGLLDYIYAVLHSPTYREKYKEFLKIDFPRVPYPKDKITFWQLVELGAEIRQIHLLESPLLENYQTKYVGNGDNIVLKPHFQNGKVFINDTQYFENVPQIAWDFYIGGYQPAQKWLKDRKDRKLDIEDIAHYQKIILALAETDRLMKEIDAIGFE